MEIGKLNEIEIQDYLWLTLGFIGSKGSGFASSTLDITVWDWVRLCAVMMKRLWLGASADVDGGVSCVGTFRTGSVRTTTWARCGYQCRR